MEDLEKKDPECPNIGLVVIEVAGERLGGHEGQ
jgi:hypothetical protein